MSISCDISSQFNTYNTFKNYVLTKYNRPVNETKLRKTIEEYEKSFNETGKINIFDFIHIGNILDNNDKLVLDGQHRFEAIKYLQENSLEQKLREYLQNRQYEVKFYSDIPNTDSLCKLINTINDRQAYTFDTQKQKIRPIFENRLKDYFMEKLPHVKQTQCNIKRQIGSLHINSIVSLVCDNEILVNIFNNCVDEGHFGIMNDFFNKIISYNSEIINKVKPIVENNNYDLNEKLTKLNEIFDHDKLKYDSLRPTNIKKEMLETIKKQIKKNFVLNIINDRNYSYWLNPIIEEFIN